MKIEHVEIIEGDRLLIRNYSWRERIRRWFNWMGKHNPIKPEMNGIYLVTSIGDGDKPFILTRVDTSHE